MLGDLTSSKGHHKRAVCRTPTGNSLIADELMTKPLEEDLIQKTEGKRQDIRASGTAGLGQRRMKGGVVTDLLGRYSRPHYISATTVTTDVGACESGRAPSDNFPDCTLVVEVVCGSSFEKL